MKKNIITILLLIIVGIYFFVVSYQMNIDKKQYGEYVNSIEVSFTSIEGKTDIENKLSVSDEFGIIKYELEERFNNIQDLYALALEIFHFAEQGDAEAQYYIYKILSRCSEYIYFSEEAYEEIVSENPVLYIEILENWRNRCVGFTANNINDFGHKHIKNAGMKAKKWRKLSAQKGYAPAVIAELDEQKLLKDEKTLHILKNAIKAKHPESIYSVAYLVKKKNKIVAYAWQLLACDYGYDCSSESKENWRIFDLLGCGSNPKYNCDPSLDYYYLAKSELTEPEFSQVLEKKKWLKEMLESGQIDELTFEQLLGE